MRDFEAFTGIPTLVREKGLEPSRLWLDTGTSSLPVYRFQHSRISRCESNYSRISGFVNHYLRAPRALLLADERLSQSMISQSRPR